MNFRDEIEKIKRQGYNEANAEVKLCQDLILLAISKSGMDKHVTIKGGVVMRSISNNSRRATQDLDLDFIQYSISEQAITRFVEKLNCLEGITIVKIGDFIELKHQDYQGKRITLKVRDREGKTISLKMDIGVHSNFRFDQEEYIFDVYGSDMSVCLLINSKEQMIAEKIKSLIRFGIRSTRYKDIFDIYYLISNIDSYKLMKYVDSYILKDGAVQNIQTNQDLVIRIRNIFQNKRYIKELAKSDKNWIGVPVDVVLNSIIDFFEKLTS